MPSKTFVALLRGINVSGHNKIPMAELRAFCTDIGWSDVRTYIRSGNLIFKASSKAPKLEAELEQLIEGSFGLKIPVIVRAATEWPKYIKGNPFPEASEKEPNLVMLALSKAPPKSDAAESIQERAANGERIERVGDALWIHFPQGAGKSKLSPALLDRLVGSPVTTRNWRTVLKLDEMIGEVDS